MDRIKIVVVGVGKIVLDQHAPVLAKRNDFDLVATASPNSGLDGVPAFPSLDALLAKGPAFDAAVISTGTGVRHDIARQALVAGKAVLLEKPPCATLSQLEDLRALAQAKGLALNASWHSRHAPAADAAKAWLAAHPPARITVTWKEDVRRWHPNQAWVWQAGGLGVFDPGVNAMSLLSAIAPASVILNAARLSVPSNKLNPIAASLDLTLGDGTPVSAELDWRQTGEQTWEIAVEAHDGGRLQLLDGGARMQVDGVEQGGLSADPHAEYDGVYARFAQVYAAGEIDVDEAPLRIAADAFLIGDRTTVEPFAD